jgi:hypothetical protein
MGDDSDHRETLMRAYETLERANRTLDRQQRDPVAGDEPMIVAHWRDCSTTAAMTAPQFDQYCRDGMPPLKPALKAPVATAVTKSKVVDMVRTAMVAERTNTQASIEAAVAIIGEECGRNEKALRAEIEAKIEAKLDAVRAAICRLERGGDDIVDLPADWRPRHVEH